MDGRPEAVPKPAVQRRQRNKKHETSVSQWHDAELHMHQVHQMQQMQHMQQLQQMQHAILPMQVMYTMNNATVLFPMNPLQICPLGICLPAPMDMQVHDGKGGRRTTQNKNAQQPKGKGRKTGRQMQEAERPRAQTWPQASSHSNIALRHKTRTSEPSDANDQVQKVQNELSMVAVQDQELELHKVMILDALTSLYSDKITPTMLLVLRRIQEKYGERWPLKHAIHLCGKMPEVNLIEGSGHGRIWSVRSAGDQGSQSTMVMLRDPPEDFNGFADQALMDDPYPADLWAQIKVFMEDEARFHDIKSRTGDEGAPLWPGSRYEFAKWMRGRLKCLADYTLGDVCRMVQLCVSKRELLGYHQGTLVPYQLSDNCRKKSHALLRCPTQIRSGEKFAQSWEQAGDVIARALEKHGGAVQLSCLKKVCRSTCQIELNECALGHTKLTEFLQDDRLKSPCGGMFVIELLGTGYHVLHKEPTPRASPSGAWSSGDHSALAPNAPETKEGDDGTCSVRTSSSCEPYPPDLGGSTPRKAYKNELVGLN